MPSDILGTKVFNLKTGEFELRKGPLFTQLFLADEINRTPPKTQSALLEVMEERAITIDGTRHEREVGANVLMLDYIEQSALKERFISGAFNVTNAQGYATGGVRLDALNPRLSCFMCPSDGSNSNPGGANSTDGLTNYVWCFGDHQVQGDTWNGRGPFIMHRERGNTSGLANLSDGTSNTIIFAEAVRPRAQTGFGACVTADPARKDPRVDLYPLFDKSKKTYITGVNSPGANYDQRGFRWASYTAWYNGFSTVLPPNGGCYASSTQSTYILAAASSNHTGGVNSAFGDGSVQFISETINWQTAGLADYLLPANSRDSDANAISKMQTFTKYGVWGALGTANGGESVTF
jgi:prepilin-type processing-associated H-X9-DG protein